MRRAKLAGVLCAVWVAVVMWPARAQKPQARPAESRASYFRNIVIAAGETAGEAVCIFCSIEVRGALSGDAVTIGGSIRVYAQVGGDVVAVGGSIFAGENVRISGDLVALGGPVERARGVEVSGDTENVWWMALPGQREVFWKSAAVFVGAHWLCILLLYPALRVRRTAHMADAQRRKWWLPPLVGLLLWAAVIGFYQWKLIDIISKGAVAWIPAWVLIGLSLLGVCGSSFLLGSRLGLGDAPCKATLLGALILFLLTQVPLAGALAYAVLFIQGCGAALVSFMAHPAWRPWPAE